MEGIRERSAPSQPVEGACCVTSPNYACVRDYEGEGVGESHKEITGMLVGNFEFNP